MKTRLLVLGFVGLALVLGKPCDTFGWCTKPLVYFTFSPKCYDESSDTYYLRYGKGTTIDADDWPDHSRDPDCSSCDECPEIICSGDDLIRGLRKYKWYFGDGTIEEETCSAQDDGDFDAETTHTYWSTGPKTVKVRVYDVDETCDNDCPPGWDDQNNELDKSIIVVRANLTMGGTPDGTEESVGGFIAYNDDDDNDNDTADWSDASVVGEDDMASLSLSLSPSLSEGQVRLAITAGTTKIKVWDSPTKGNLVIPNGSPPQYYKTWDLSSESLPTGDYYVEGCASSTSLRDTELTLSYSTCSMIYDKIKITVIDVDYTEDASQTYGYDKYTDTGSDTPSFFPHKSVKVGATDTAYADISGTSAIANEVYFTSSDAAVTTISPSSASSTHQQVTFTGVLEGSAQGLAELYDPVAYDIIAARIGVYAYNEDPYTVAFRVVHEDDDDTQPISVGNGKANTDCVDTGSNGICNTSASGDDVQLIALNQGESYQTAITAGGNATLDTTPSGDDTVVGSTITTGADGVCNTTAVGDDVQVIPVAQGQPNVVCIDTGANGVCNTSKSGDDNQPIELNKGLANQICVSFGANGFRDTVKAGDDDYTGASIHTGPDGICDTAADNSDDTSDTPFTAAALAQYLNEKTYNQAVVKWTVTKLSDKDAPFDLNCDGQIDVGSWTTSEMNVVITECKDDSFNYNIFIVNNPSDGSCGTMQYNQRYGFVHPDQCTSCVDNVTAHELGHGGFVLVDLPGSPDTNNLMRTPCTCHKRLRKGQWGTIQSVTPP
jgi:hypothetical protein